MALHIPATADGASTRRRNAWSLDPDETGEMPEWLKGTDCKSVGFAYVGSNPTLSTIRPEIDQGKAGIAQW